MNQFKNRRSFLAKLFMGIGSLMAYGAFAIKGILFLSPKRGKKAKKKIFVGTIDQFKTGYVETVHGLRGQEILVQRNQESIRGFSATCPHLGCKVHWESDAHRFFCPCHGAVFDQNGKAITGPPADAGQDMDEVDLEMDESSGVVYLNENIAS